MDPLYTSISCRSAYQLRWSLALFPEQLLPPIVQWIDHFNQAADGDGIRILEGGVSKNGALMLLLSTRPQAKPSLIVKSVKGRLQHLLRPQMRLAWRRNFRLTSVGDANIATVENYVAKQLDHHPLASAKSQQNLADYQWRDPATDLAQPVFSSHGQYVLALHLVFVHSEHWRNVSSDFVQKTQRAILQTATKKGQPISRLSILADHVHFTLRFGYDSSPEEVALSYMNNVSYRHGMLRIWMDSFYVGSIGPYDMNAVRS